MDLKSTDLSVDCSSIDNVHLTAQQRCTCGQQWSSLAIGWASWLIHLLLVSSLTSSKQQALSIALKGKQSRHLHRERYLGHAVVFCTVDEKYWNLNGSLALAATVAPYLMQYTLAWSPGLNFHEFGCFMTTVQQNLLQWSKQESLANAKVSARQSKTDFEVKLALKVILGHSFCNQLQADKG